MPRKEAILNTFYSDNEQSRLVVIRCVGADGAESLVLQNENFADDVGWFVQSRIDVLPEQIAGLKATLTCGKTACPATNQSSTNGCREIGSAEPAILSFDRATRAKQSVVV